MSSMAGRGDLGKSRDPCVWVVGNCRPADGLRRERDSAQRIHSLYPSTTMKKSGSGQRAPSPTPTAFSGISSYRTDSYKPFRDKSISSTPIETYQIALGHFHELSKYLASYLAKGSISPLSPFNPLTF